MSDRNQILVAFFIPLGLAIGLSPLGYGLWRPVHNDPGFFSDHGFVFFEETFPLAFYEFWIFIPALVLLAFLMPAFLIRRNYQNCQNETESPSIFG